MSEKKQNAAPNKDQNQASNTGLEATIVETENFQSSRWHFPVKIKKVILLVLAIAALIVVALFAYNYFFGDLPEFVRNPFKQETPEPLYVGEDGRKTIVFDKFLVDELGGSTKPVNAIVKMRVLEDWYYREPPVSDESAMGNGECEVYEVFSGDGFVKLTIKEYCNEISTESILITPTMQVSLVPDVEGVEDDGTDIVRFYEPSEGVYRYGKVGEDEMGVGDQIYPHILLRLFSGNQGPGVLMGYSFTYSGEEIGKEAALAEVDNIISTVSLVD